MSALLVVVAICSFGVGIGGVSSILVDGALRYQGRASSALPFK